MEFDTSDGSMEALSNDTGVGAAADAHAERYKDCRCIPKTRHCESGNFYKGTSRISSMKKDIFLSQKRHKSSPSRNLEISTSPSTKERTHRDNRDNRDTGQAAILLPVQLRGISTGSTDSTNSSTYSSSYPASTQLLPLNQSQSTFMMPFFPFKAKYDVLTGGLDL
ncbi:hypothetical protein ACMFMG_000012 [Clarireedia jacksonii]